MRTGRRSTFLFPCRLCPLSPSFPLLVSFVANALCLRQVVGLNFASRTACISLGFSSQTHFLTLSHYLEQQKAERTECRKKTIMMKVICGRR
jgi:hypothetical protein